MLRLSWPKILVMLTQASTGLIGTWWISHRGTNALAGMAVVASMVVATGGGWLALQLTGSENWLFTALAVAWCSTAS